MESIKSELLGYNVFERFSRVETITNKIRFIIKKYNTTGKRIVNIAIENYSLNSKGHLVELVELGTLVRQLFHTEYTIVEVSPMGLKKYCIGTAKGLNKSLILKEVYRKWNVDTNNDNIADAVVLAKISKHYYETFNNIETNYLQYENEVITTLLKPKKKVIKRRSKKIKIN